MNVLHFATGNLTGGAARGALWLHESLLDNGLNSAIVTSQGVSSAHPFAEPFDMSIFRRPRNLYHFYRDTLPARAYTRRKKRIFSTGTAGFDVTKHRLYSSADIIHLHWVNEGFLNFKHLRRIDKPIVWTMRDMWLFTGGCHYSLDCRNYTHGCGNCPQLCSKKSRDLSSYVVSRKQRYLPNTLTIVGISNWLAECAKSSSLFRNARVETIHNCIDTTVFSPIRKADAKRALGLGKLPYTILLGARGVDDFYKGLDLAVSALLKVRSSGIQVVTFGKLDIRKLHQIPFEVHSLGYINEDNKLRMAYSAADVFLAPSKQEAFGKTLTEAMACQTPVVCFDATGPADVVDHMINGYKATPFDPGDYASGIDWILNQPDREFLGVNARAKVMAEFSKEVISAKYARLYEELRCN